MSKNWWIREKVPCIFFKYFKKIKCENRIKPDEVITKLVNNFINV